MFEGIGCLLPVMREVEKPDLYPIQTIGALIFLCTIYVLFAFTCYYAWGSNLDEPVVTEMLPPDNHFVQVMKLLFCLNLMISFPVTIVPVYHALEAVIGKEETSQEEEETAAIETGDEAAADGNIEEDDHGGEVAGTGGETRL